MRRIQHVAKVAVVLAIVFVLSINTANACRFLRWTRAQCGPVYPVTHCSPIVCAPHCGEVVISGPIITGCHPHVDSGYHATPIDGVIVDSSPTETAPSDGLPDVAPQDTEESMPEPADDPADPTTPLDDLADPEDLDAMDQDAPLDEPADEPAPFDEPAEESLPFDEPADEPAPFDEPADEGLPNFDEPADDPAPLDEPADDPLPFDEPADEPAPFDEPADEGLPNFDEPADDPAPFDEPTPFDEPADDPAPFDEPADEGFPGFDEPADDPAPFDEPADDGLPEFGEPGDGDAGIDPADADVNELFNNDEVPGAADDEPFNFDEDASTPARDATKGRPGNEVDSSTMLTKVRSKSNRGMRLWTDNTGRYQTVGRLAVIAKTHVRLLKDNGRYSTVPLSRLSSEDLTYVLLVAKKLTTGSEQLASR